MSLLDSHHPFLVWECDPRFSYWELKGGDNHLSHSLATEHSRWHLSSSVCHGGSSLRFLKQIFLLFLKSCLAFVVCLRRVIILAALHSLHRPTGVCLILLLGTFSSLRWKRKKKCFWSSKKELISSPHPIFYSLLTLDLGKGEKKNRRRKKGKKKKVFAIIPLYIAGLTHVQQ